MSGNLLDYPKIWVLGTKNKCQETFWDLQKNELWAPKSNVRKPSGLSKNMKFGHHKQMAANLLGSPKTWVLGTKKKVRQLSGLSKNMSFGQHKPMSGNLLGSPKTWVLGTKNKCQETFCMGSPKTWVLGTKKKENLLGAPKTWVLGTKNKCQEIFWAFQKHEFWAPKTNVRKPSGLSKNMKLGHQKQMSGNLLDSPKTWVLGTKNKRQETFWALQKYEFWAPKTYVSKPSGLSKTMSCGYQKNARKPSGLSKNRSFGHQKQMSANRLGSPKTSVLGIKNKCQETFWALQKHEFWTPKTNVRKLSGLSKKHEFWTPKTNVRKPSGLSKNMKFGHQKQMAGNLLGSPKTWISGTKNKCQETVWALQKNEFWAPKTNVRKSCGLSKNMRFGHQKQMSGNLLGSPKHEFWAPKTNGRKSSGLSRNMSFGHQKQMSGNLLGSPKTWLLGTKNKCQETFWALQKMSFGHQKQMSGSLLGSPKHEFRAPKANVRKPFGLSKNMSSGHQKQMSGNLLGSPKTWILENVQKHEFWAPKTNVRKPSGLSKNVSFGRQQQMSGNLLDSPKTWVVGTKNKCQETFWALQKQEIWAPKTNVRKPSGLSKKMSFGHQKQMSGNRLGSPKKWVLGTNNKCQETFWALQK